MKLYALAPLFFQKIIWIPTRCILGFFAHMKVSGLENITDIRTNVIFAMNHSSEIDPFIVPSSLPFFSRFSPLFYTTKEKKFYSTNGWRKHMFGGLFINAWGGYTVRTGTHDYAQSLSQHLEIMKDGYSFCIFPEGGITKDGNIRPAHGGIAYQVEVGQIPVVPVSVSGVYNTSFIDFFTFKREIKVNFGKPVYPTDLEQVTSDMVDESANRYKIQADYIMGKVKEGLVI